MTWDPRRLSIEVVEQFAAATSWSSQDALTICARARATRLEKDADRQRFIRDKRLAKGWCARCDTPRDPRSIRHCTKHHEENRDEAAKRRAPVRERLPADRFGVTQKFTIITRRPDDNGVQEVDIYLTANTYPDDYAIEDRRGQLGEVLIRIGKAGHTEAIYGELAKNMSKSLQCRMPVDDVFRTHVGTRFDPYGATTHPLFKRCTSPLDLVSRWILLRYGSVAAKAWIASMQNQPVIDEGEGL